jgi:hypothetical protein
MPAAGRNEDRVTGADVATVAVDLELAAAFDDQIDLLAARVVVPTG